MSSAAFPGPGALFYISAHHSCKKQCWITICWGPNFASHTSLHWKGLIIKGHKEISSSWGPRICDSSVVSWLTHWNSSLLKDAGLLVLLNYAPVCDNLKDNGPHMFCHIIKYLFSSLLHCLGRIWRYDFVVRCLASLESAWFVEEMCDCNWVIRYLKPMPGSI